MRQECVPWVTELYFPQPCFQQLLVVVLRESLKTGKVHDGISARIQSSSLQCGLLGTGNMEMPYQLQIVSLAFAFL